MTFEALSLDTIARGSKKPIPFRYTAEIDGDFVVFLIGMRINAWWKPHRWLPVLKAMQPMLDELTANPDRGLLGYKYLGKLSFVQYWRSFEHLEAYARAGDLKHWPAWVQFNRTVKGSRGDVGIWHETFIVRLVNTRRSTRVCLGRDWEMPVGSSIPPHPARQHGRGSEESRTCRNSSSQPTAKR